MPVTQPTSSYVVEEFNQAPKSRPQFSFAEATANRCSSAEKTQICPKQLLMPFLKSVGN